LEKLKTTSGGGIYFSMIQQLICEVNCHFVSILLCGNSFSMLNVFSGALQTTELEDYATYRWVFQKSEWGQSYTSNKIPGNT